MFFDLQAGRRRVAAVGDQELAALGQRGVQIEARHAPRRADARPHARLVPGDHHHRPVEAVGQPAGHDADHARMPAAIGQHQRGVFGRVELFLGLFGGGQLDAPFQGLPRGVQPSMYWASSWARSGRSVTSSSTANCGWPSRPAALSRGAI